MSGARSSFETLEAIKGLVCRKNVVLANLTSLRVGGPADLVVDVENVRTLQDFLTHVSTEGVKWFVLGAGTNVIFPDSGFGGVVVRLGRGFSEISSDGTTVFAGASAAWSDLISFCAAHSVSGLERMAGIPGTVGGAIAGNAGAFGVTVGERVREVKGFTVEGGEKKLPRARIRFEYRKADFGTRLVITEAALALEHRALDLILAEVEETLARRKERQPLEFPSAGSIFKNPPGMKAGKLIEEAGLKGRSFGGAEVSRKHANFIVNIGGARSSDVLSLIEIVREEIWKRFSVALELEVKVVGETA